MQFIDTVFKWLDLDEESEMQVVMTILRYRT